MIVMTLINVMDMIDMTIARITFTYYREVVLSSLLLAMVGDKMPSRQANGVCLQI